jgi:UDP-N-acetylmuramoyl-tripeptide--D-alanyl-D-alanine ligase
MWQQKTILEALESSLTKNHPQDNIDIKEVLIDSRVKSNNGLFIAVVGQINDGHNYLEQVFNNGAALAIVQRIPDSFKNDKRLILVKDTNQALQDLAKYSRNRFKGKIIAVTGSVGKTSVKEMLRTVLSNKNNIFATHGNLNNHFGLPLSLCNLDQNCDYGILEMGMSNLGEIEFLTNIAKPHIAIISNVTAAHIGNFNNEQEIALAKSEIFLGLVKNGHAIINKDNKYCDFLESQALKNGINKTNIISFGKSEASEVVLKSFEIINNSQANVKVQIASELINYKINNINESTIYNSLIAIATLKVLDVKIDDYLPAFTQLITPKGRGNLIQLNKNNLSLTIIDDSYNANLTSVTSGLKFLSALKKQNPNSRTIAIIGDMLELGEHEIQEHEKIAHYIEEFNIDKVLLVGPLTKNTLAKLDKNKIIGHFDNSKLLANNIIDLVQTNDILLIKGSRGTKMEIIIKALENV